MMFFYIIATNRQEGAESDMEGEVVDLDTFFSEFMEQRFGHVETGGRSGGATSLFCPDSLIASNIGSFGVSVEVGW